MRSDFVDDDSSGKRKVSNVRARSAMLTGALLVGVCLGVIVSEKVYLITQEGDLPASAVAAARSRKLEVSRQAGAAAGGGGGGSTVAAAVAGCLGGDDSVPRSTGDEPSNKLEEILRKNAPQGEVMIAISNMNLIHEQSLVMWLDCVQRLPELKNWLVVAIDEQLRDYCVERGIPHYYRPVVIPDSQKDTGSNHAISAMKYEIIREFLQLGWNVLLSDVDIVTLQNPFDHLHRDSDVEGMTDGHSDGTAYGEIYGIDDASMGWSRYAQGTQHMAFNSGLFYIKANARTIDLLTRIADRLNKEKAWDQSVWNEAIFFLSHGEYKSPQVIARTMDFFKFMNTKVLFKQVRHMPKDQQPKPVMVHTNFHPDKSERMRAIIEYYIKGDEHALEKFPGGSEPGTRR